MTNHLPECPCIAVGVPSCICDNDEECGPQCRHHCICAALRTCEQRVRDEFRSTIHACPPSGSGVMPCCGRTPFEVLADRLTNDLAFVNCTGGRGFAAGWRLGVGDGYRKGVQAASNAACALFPQERYPGEHAAILGACDALRGES